jgi:S-adenosylmethionine synthetase
MRAAIERLPDADPTISARCLRVSAGTSADGADSGEVGRVNRAQRPDLVLEARRR